MIFKQNKNFIINDKKQKILIKLILFIIFIFTFKINNKKYKNTDNINLFYTINETEFFPDIYINIFNINYSFSFIFKKIKIEYYIKIKDLKNNTLSPTDLQLYNDINIICHLEVLNYNFSIYSLSYIHQNKYFICTEYLNIYENINIGIKILKKNSLEYNFLCFNDDLINYNYLRNKNDNIFDPFVINKKFLSYYNSINNTYQKSSKFKSSFIQYPSINLKRNSSIKEEEWIFKNIYNNYFCFCKGNKCFNNIIHQRCKYLFYMYIIDNDRDLYQKDNYLFVDFIFKEYSPDDTFPVFKEMLKEGFSVHYITEDINIYNKYCNISKCLTILLINWDIYFKYGDFIEKYLFIILKLKAVISGKISPNHNISELFYNLDYITYIAVGHGVCYFKDFLFTENEIYGINRNNKILIPPSKRLISVVKKYGWKDEDIIKINLPRWDEYEKKYDKSINNEKLNKNSIFIMFTWRNMKKNKNISYYYNNNIMKLLTNKYLLKELNKYNITLYFTLHRILLNKYKNLYVNITKKSKFLQYIKQNEISECLSKTNLVVTDFSSVVFDLIYRRKPFIIYVPDIDDPKINDIYIECYYKTLISIKNNTFNFENIYLNINETINKIIYYIKNNFKIEKKLEKFYNSFNLKRGKNINRFIKYLKALH